MKAWTRRHVDWIKLEVHFEEQAQQWTLEDYVNEVEHCSLRIKRLDAAIDEAISSAPESIRAVVEALQALRGVAKVTAVTIVAEVGQLSRFPTARQLMGYSGAVSSEYPSGTKTGRGGITKSGNAHFRRVVVEAAWSQRFSPVLSRTLKLRKKHLPAEVQEIAAAAGQRLHKRYMHLASKGKDKNQVVTAVARELLGFVWIVGVTVERRYTAAWRKRDNYDRVERAKVGGHTERRILVAAMRRLAGAGSAILVRGSSRRVDDHDGGHQIDQPSSKAQPTFARINLS